MRLKIDKNGPNNLYLNYKASREYDKIISSNRHQYDDIKSLRSSLLRTNNSLNTSFMKTAG